MRLVKRSFISPTFLLIQKNSTSLQRKFRNNDYNNNDYIGSKCVFYSFLVFSTAFPTFTRVSAIRSNVLLTFFIISIKLVYEHFKDVI